MRGRDGATGGTTSAGARAARGDRQSTSAKPINNAFATLVVAARRTKMFVVC